MATIVDKVFNPVQRIIKAVFRSSPNLITAGDLNRQFDIINYQLGLLGKSVGAVTDLSVTYTYGSTMTITYNSTYLKFKGINFGGFSSTVDFENNPTESYRLVLTGVKTLVTSSTDPDNTISGAKFSDGTVMPAADHYVYENVTLNILKSTDSVPVGSEEIITLAKIIPFMGSGVASGTYVLNTFFTLETSNIWEKLAALHAIKGVYPSAPAYGDLPAGTTYDNAFSILNKGVLALKGDLLAKTDPVTKSGNYTFSQSEISGSYEVVYFTFGKMCFVNIKSRITFGGGEVKEFAYLGDSPSGVLPAISKHYLTPITIHESQRHAEDVVFASHVYGGVSSSTKIRFELTHNIVVNVAVVEKVHNFGGTFMYVMD